MRGVVLWVRAPSPKSPNRPQPPTTTPHQKAAFNIEIDEDFSYLFSRDVVKLKKLLTQCISSSNKEEYYEKIKENQIIMLKRIDYFLTNLIDKEVIQKNEIDFEDTQ